MCQPHLARKTDLKKKKEKKEYTAAPALPTLPGFPFVESGAEEEAAADTDPTLI